MKAPTPPCNPKKSRSETTPSIFILHTHTLDYTQQNQYDTTMNPTELWSRLPGETEAAFAAFEIYRNELKKPRSLKKLARKMGTSYGVLGNWSSQYRWSSRAKAWDSHCARARDKVVLSEQAKIAREQLRAWERVRSIAEATLVRLGQDIVSKDEKAAGNNIGYNGAVQALQCATSAERLILGEVTERTESATKHSLDLSKLTDEELKTLEALEAKAAAG